eukprot:3157427-Prymnesium_polylepis.1
MSSSSSNGSSACNDSPPGLDCFADALSPTGSPTGMNRAMSPCARSRTSKWTRGVVIGGAGTPTCMGVAEGAISVEAPQPMPPCDDAFWQYRYPHPLPGNDVRVRLQWWPSLPPAVRYQARGFIHSWPMADVARGGIGSLRAPC